MSDIIHLEPIRRMGSHMLLAGFGLSGSGKTLSLIKIALGLVKDPKKIALIDTETGRGRIYADDAPGIMYGEFTPPFTPERYVDMLQQVEGAGIECCILDSGSHEWEGIGGILEIADAQRTSAGHEMKGQGKWAKPKARHKRFKNYLLTSRMHLLISLRAREKLEEVKQDIPNGPKKGSYISKGILPIQEDVFKNEMIVQLEFMEREVNGIMRGGFFRVDKCPERLLGAFSAGGQIGVHTGEAIAKWIAGGDAVDPVMHQLKLDADNAAQKGMIALKTWRDTLPKQQQAMLVPFMDNFKSIATTADEEAAAAAAGDGQSDSGYGTQAPSDFADYNQPGAQQ